MVYNSFEFYFVDYFLIFSHLYATKFLLNRAFLLNMLVEKLLSCCYYFDHHCMYMHSKKLTSISFVGTIRPVSSSTKYNDELLTLPPNFVRFNRHVMFALLLILISTRVGCVSNDTEKRCKYICT